MSSKGKIPFSIPDSFLLSFEAQLAYSLLETSDRLSGKPAKQCNPQTADNAIHRNSLPAQPKCSVSLFS